MSAPAKKAPMLSRRPQLSEDVADHVRGLIMSGQIRPGEYIRLDDTAHELGVSVTPVREALLALRGEGMVRQVPHRGYIVTDLSRSDVEDIFWLQEQIAVRLTLRAAERADAEDLAALEQLCRGLAAAVEAGDLERIIDAEFVFHRTINRIAGGRKLAWFLHGAVRYTPHRLYAADPGWAEHALACHRELIAAIAAGDRDTVADCTRRLYTDGEVRLLAHLDRIGMWDGQTEAEG